MNSLWGEEFNIQPTKQVVKQIKKKIENKKSAEVSTTKIIKSKKLDLDDKLRLIETEVNRILGGYSAKTKIITSVEELSDYINTSIQNGVVAVDTETNNSLEPITCKLMGVCLYTPNEYNVYIPINHVDRFTNDRLDWQVTEQDIYNQLSRLQNTKIVMHNGKFDYEVFKCTCNLELPIYWDTMIGARILDENELSAGLKQQYISKIDPSIEKYSIDHLFEDIQYAILDPNLFALYAATDAFMTYKLYEWQKDKFELPENTRLYNLFREVEMPVVPVLANMELTGVKIDVDYAKRLQSKYQKLSDEVDLEIANELNKYSTQIQEWRNTEQANYKPPVIEKSTGRQKVDDKGQPKFSKSKNEQLENPPSVVSPMQLAILLYDIFNVGVIDKKSPRGTGEDILKKIDLPLCKLILKKRGLLKLKSTYIDNVLQLIENSVDGRVRTHFNQLGADTGRLSSSNPINLQNIPSHEYSIRMMFCAEDGKILVGGDYSQQEPRLLSQYSQDESMIKSYKENKDLYAVIASEVYHNNYEDNKEFYPDGKMNPEGKKRRTNCKSLLLGMMYGRGVSSIAEQIKKNPQAPATEEDIKEARHIQDSFFKSFPKVKQWIDETQHYAKINGYVEDLWGRRRRLPDIKLPKFDIQYNGSSSDFNPLLYSKNIYTNQNNELLEKYRMQLNNARSKKDIDSIKERAKIDNITIKDNTGFISQAERQSVNSRIQGGAASMSKRAMIVVHNDALMKQLGFKLSISVHDELIGECPIENSEKVKQRLSELMISAALPQCQVPMKCDVDCFHAWYEDVYSSQLKKEKENKLKQGLSEQETLQYLYQTYSECTTDQINNMLQL